MEMYRQGDVLIVRTNGIPETAKIAKRDQGRVVLAYGEVTGHAHAIAAEGCEMLESEDGEHFLRVDDVELRIAPKTIVDADLRDVQLVDGTIVRFAPDEFLEAEIAIRESRQLTTRGVLVEHEEHAAVIVVPGVYALPGQREYVAPEIERRVAD